MTTAHQCEYGPVLIIKGEYRGRIGFYDDDNGSKLVVYLGPQGADDSARLMLRGSVVMPTHDNLVEYTKRMMWPYG